MKAAFLDRLLMIWIGAALVLWTACLVIGWAWAIDSSGASALITLAAALLAISIAMRLPGQAARAIQKLLVWFDMQNVADIELSATRAALQGRDAGGGITRLLAAAAVLGAIGGLVSTAALWVGAAIADTWADQLLWSDGAWLVVKFALQLLGMLPIAIGIAFTFLVGAMVRVGPPRDLYAALCRDWLWAGAIACGAFAAAWRSGMNLTALALTMPLVLVAAAIVLVGRARVNLPLRPLVRPIAQSPQRLRRCLIVICHAAVAITLVLQVRLLRDAAGLSTAGAAGWVAVSAALLAVFFRRTDRKPKPHGKVSATAAAIGLAAAVMVQFILAAACVRANLSGQNSIASLICAAAAIGLQIPTAALAAVMLSRQRRLFAADGGRARSYVSCATGGLAMGLVAFLAAAYVRNGGLILTGIALAILTVGLLNAIARAGNTAGHVKWLACAAGLMCSLSAAMLITVSEIATRMAPGVWLTSMRSEPAGADHQRCGLLPNPPTRGGYIDAALSDVVLRLGPSCRWWTVAPCPADSRGLGDTLPAAFDGDFLMASRVVFTRFDAILLAPGPADHPLAWRMYADKCLRRCMARLNPGGYMVLRMQVSVERPGWAIALAESVRQTAGDGWLAAERAGSCWDILIHAPAGDSIAPSRDGLHVVRLSEMHDRWRQVRPLRILHPMSPATRRISTGEFEQFLRQSADHLPTSRPVRAAM